MKAARSWRSQRGRLFVLLLSLGSAGSLQAQSPFLRDDIDDPEYSDAYSQRLRDLRERVAEERRERQERIERERCDTLEDQTSRWTRPRYNYGRYTSTYGTDPVPRATPTPSYYRPSGYSSYSSNDSDECDDENKQEELRRQREDDEGFAAASGKCGDVTTQKIGSFYYHSNGGVTQKIGNFFHGPDGQVTQKIGNFYYHSDGTTTQRIGNFYYDSDGGVTQKIGSFYYHSGGEPCENEDKFADDAWLNRQN